MLLKLLDNIWLFLRFIDFRVIESADDIPFDVRYFLKRIVMTLSYIKPIFLCDGDYAVTNGLFAIMAHKFRRVEKEMRHLVNSGKYKREINWAIDRLEELANNKFENDFHNAHENKWGEREVHLDGQNFDVYGAKAKTEEEKEQERKEFVAAYKEAAEKRAKTMRDVMLFIGENADHWWD